MAQLPKSTARLSQIERSDLPADKQHIFDEIAGSRGAVRGPFAMLLHSPDVAQRIAHTGAYIRFETTLPDDLREIAILTTARFWDCQYEWTAHQKIAETEVGVRDEAIAAIRDRKAPAGLTPDEKIVFNYVFELLNNHRVSDAAFNAANDRFGDKATVDLTATAGYYSMIGGVLNACNVEPDVPTLPVNL